MVSAGSNVLYTDINTIITSINSEDDARTAGGSQLTNITSVSAGDAVDKTKFLAMISRNVEINAIHCYCQGQSTIETRNGGTSLTLTALTTEFESEDYVDDTAINRIITDITNLVAQCDCNSYGCTCDTNAPTICTNNTYSLVVAEEPDCCSNNKVCACFNVCINQTVCTCNIDCTCDNVCTCEYGG